MDTFLRVSSFVSCVDKRTLLFHKCVLLNYLIGYTSCAYMYCKCGYFRWGKISRNCWQVDFSRGGNFHDVSPISLIKSYGFYFPAGEIFANKTISRKTQKLPPCENFCVYSNRKFNQYYSVW